MTMLVGWRARRVVAALAAGVILVACNGDNGDGNGPGTDDEVETTDDTDGDDGEGDGSDDEVAAPPASEVTVEPLDAPLSSAEIRVGELIVEFDGEVVDEGTLLTLEEPILFDFDSAVLKPESWEALDNVAEVLGFYEGAPVEVIGHTDDQGSREYNLGLSSDRAEAVVGALTDRGIPAGRISSEGRAFDDLVADNDTEEGRTQNRRVEVLIVGVVPPDEEDDADDDLTRLANRRGR